jgi:UPF0755 protein
MAKKKKKKWIFIIGGLNLFSGLALVFWFYATVFFPNVKKDGFLYIPTGSTFQQVQDSLRENDFLKDQQSFDLWLRIKSQKSNAKPGRYELRKGMTNRQLVNILRGGLQTPIRLTFNNIRTFDQLASRVSNQIEADSASLMQAFFDPDFLEKHQLSAREMKAIFIPNTYELWWNTSAPQFVERMRIEHEKFWTEERRRKAKTRNLTPIQVSILASIVEEETKKNDEKPIVASVYLNRLKRGMLLQADPTVKYGFGDFELRRILNIHLQHDSPFNTYIYKGLPPGPISFPSTIALDAVLNSPPTEYLFFCARPDFSGYHAFAKTYSEHLQNARRYWDFLNQNKIR